tara:strand:+ start:12513 stop:14039 length:1527 start_codon:yes stop_codon:yes gene_type:complete
MNTKKYNWILYLISATIVLTVAVQFYWNYKNYQENKKRVRNEIQISLDNAIEEYYSNLSKSEFFSFVSKDSLNSISINSNDTIIRREIYETDSINNLMYNVTSVSVRGEGYREFKALPKFLDSLIQKNKSLTKSKDSNLVFEKNRLAPFSISIGRKLPDSLRLMKGLRSVYIALTNNDIDFTVLDSIFSQQLEQKGIQSTFYFHYYDKDSLIQTTKNDSTKVLATYINAKTTYLSPTQKLKVYHSDPTISALKKSSTGILLSLLLSLSVITSLFYLLKIINKQKELAEIKNDLISNITHEFKTPIATVSTAIEAIANFNVLDNKEKTQKYLSMSSLQLKKLHLMVEKLLETATLDSENLILKKEDIDLVDLITRITQKHQMLTDKEVVFSSNIESKLVKIDLFHFENSISNLIDNAIKYGGDRIEVNVNSVLNHTEISVADNGSGIEKNQQEKIFEKFYRIPKGNKHDVKGFGIGLYYTKKIVEKHEGTVSILSNNQNTIFKISLPNE